MKHKIFTLVELLAVIVILVVISLITIPIIGNVIEDSRRKAFESSVQGLVESANYYTIEHNGIYIGEKKGNKCVIRYDAIMNKYVATLDDGTGIICIPKKKSIR